MTDYFALLDQPRRPWLEPDALKQAFHTKSLQLHPDAQHDRGADTAFVELNQAYQLLQDPKQRIHHLLALEGRTPPRDADVPAEVADLFPIVAELTQRADGLAQKAETATTPLTRSLLKPQLLEARSRLAETLQRLRQLHEDAVVRSQRLSTVQMLAENDWAQLHEIYLRLSYLRRWIAELEEKQLRLAKT